MSFTASGITRFILGESGNRDQLVSDRALSALCRVLEVTRSGFYAWLARGPSDHAIDDQKLALEIAAIYKASDETYGSPRVHAELLAKGLEVSRKRVARMMRELGLRSRRKRRFKATTDSGHKLPVAENVLDRKFEVDAPDVAWSPTSPTSGPTKDGCTSRRSSICSRDAWSATP